MTIITKISIPFNLEEKEEKNKLSEKEKKAKEHLEDTTEITRNMGYDKKTNEYRQVYEEIDQEKGREK